MAHSLRRSRQISFVLAAVAGLTPVGIANADDVRVRIVASVPTVCVADYAPGPVVSLTGASRLGAVTTFCNAVGGYSLRITDAAPTHLVYNFSQTQGVQQVSDNVFRIAPLRHLNTDLLASGSFDADAVAQTVRIEIMPQT